MLDQNTDRMWYVIGALVIGAGIIVLANKTMPDAFAKVTDSFDNVTDNALASISSLGVEYTDAKYFTWVANTDGSGITITDYSDDAPKDVAIPREINGQPVTRIQNVAFRKKGITSVIIPNTVTYIGQQSFMYNELQHVTIPNAVKFIGNNSFTLNQLTSVTISKDATVESGAFDDIVTITRK